MNLRVKTAIRTVLVSLSYSLNLGYYVVIKNHIY